MSRSHGEAARQTAGQAAVTSDKRYLLHLSFEEDNVCRPSLRDTEDGTLRTFSRLTEMLSFLEQEHDVHDPATSDIEVPAQRGEGERP